MKIAKRIISAFMAIVMSVLLLPPRATAVETDPYYVEFGITYEQLFDLYPEYLHSKAEDAVTDIIIDKYTDVLEEYSASDDFVASYIYILRQNGGFSFYLREIMAAFNLTESTEEKMAMDTMMLLMRNICNNRFKQVDDLVSDVEDNFSAIKGVYDIAKASDREAFVESLQGACKSLSSKQVADITETIFCGELKEVFDKLDDTIDLADKIITVFATFELEAEIIKIIRDAVPENSGLREHIDLFLANRCTTQAFIKNYGSEEALKLVEKAILKVAKPNFSVITVAFEILDYCADIFYPGPDAADLQRAIALSGYVNGIYSGVASKRSAIAQSDAITDKDLSDYEILYGAYIEAIRTTLESTKSLASGSKKDAIELAIPICDTLTYDKYISICMEELKADIDAGLVEPPEDLVPDGTSGEYGYLTYEITNGEIVITDCNTKVAGEFTIPSHIQGYPVTNIGDHAFDFCDSLTSVTIPDSVTSIGGSAFSYCESLTSVTIGNGVTSIGHWAFNGCDSLKNVYITDIAAWCNIDFHDGPHSSPITENLYLNGILVTDLVIPDSVTSISYGAFALCESLTSVTIPDSVSSIGDSAFIDCTSLTSVTIPDSVTSIGSGAFQRCASLTSVTIPDSVTSIGSGAFGGCERLASVAIPNSVTSISAGAFFGCESLTSVTIPNSVTSIGSSAFANCQRLASVTIPDSVTSIGWSAFQYCFSLTSVTIGNGVTSIGSEAFFECDSLTNVAIGNSVTSIGDNAFAICDSLIDVSYCGTEAQWNQISVGRNNTALINAKRSYHKSVVDTLFKEPTYTSMGERVYTCSYCGEEIVETIPAKFYGTSVNLGNTLDMYFGFYTGLVDEGGKVVFVREFADGTTETTEAPITAFNKNNSVYDITYTDLAAKEMCDTIHVYVYNGEGTLVGQHSDSIRSYILRQLREKEHEQEFRTLCIDLLNYGAAAQEAFGYNADDLVNKDLTVEELAEGTQKVADYADKQTISGTAEIYYYGTAYFLETQISMSMAVYGGYFNEGCYALVSYIDHTGTEKTDIRLAGVKNNSVYEFVLNEIVVADGRCLLTIEFYKADGTKVLTVQDSMESYTARNAEVYPLAEKMLAFSDSAYKYLHRNDQ